MTIARRFAAALWLACGVLVCACSPARAAGEPWRLRMEARLSRALDRYEAIERAGGWQPVPQGDTLERGDRSARVEALRRRLEATGDLAGGSGDGYLFDRSLDLALRAFQNRHGLLVDGLAGRETLAALNVPVGDRVATLRLNMERVRNFDPRADNYMLVNIAGFVAWLVRGGNVALESRVIVGKPSWPTPHVDSTIRQITINPYWNIPPRILVREIIPHIRHDPGYIANQKLRVFDKWGDGARALDPAAVDWTSRSARDLHLRQEPGDTNALGRLKFQFDNPYDVYMHDTPNKTLFEKPVRAFSHGCVRVQNPFELALALLQGQPGWDAAGLKAAIDSGRNRKIDLSRPLPIYLVYWTAWVDGDGIVQFRRDIYERDAEPGFMAEKQLLATTSECSAIG